MKSSWKCQLYTYFVENNIVEVKGFSGCLDNNGLAYTTIKITGLLSETENVRKEFFRLLTEFLHGRKVILWREFPREDCDNDFTTYSIVCRLTSYGNSETERLPK